MFEWSWLVFILLCILIWNYFVLPILMKSNVTLISPKDTIEFFPTYAYPSDPEETIYKVPIHAWVTTHYQTYDSIRKWVTAKIGATAESKVRLEETISRFTLINRRAVQIHLHFDKQADAPFDSVTGPNGHAHQLFEVPKAFTQLHIASERIWKYSALLPAGDDRNFPGEARLLRHTGINVISDIDDTIKISNVLHKDELLKNTFARPYVAVPGMSALYNHWKGKLHSSDICFHYVSGSPWQLYGLLSQFLHKDSEFPQGSYHLRFWRLKDREAFSVLGSPYKFKTKILEPMIELQKERQFILVGDSGEKDPEVYANLATKFPSQIVHIFIRNVTQHDPKRLDGVFKGIPESKVTVFEDANALLAHQFDL